MFQWLDKLSSSKRMQNTLLTLVVSALHLFLLFLIWLHIKRSMSDHWLDIFEIVTLPKKEQSAILDSTKSTSSLALQKKVYPETKIQSQQTDLHLYSNKKIKKYTFQTKKYTHTLSLSHRQIDPTYQNNKKNENQATSILGDRGITRAANVVERIKPIYPLISKNNGEEGVVRLRIKVLSTGQGTDIKIIHSSGYPRLDQAALKTVMQKYRFIPALRDGHAITSEVEFDIRFVLEVAE